MSKAKRDNPDRVKQGTMMRTSVFSCLPLATVLLGACTVTPQPLSVQAQAMLVDHDRKTFFAGVEPVKRPLTLADAIARAVKYNLDHNLKVREEALALGQTQLSEQGMLPKLTVRAGYTGRNNQSGASSVSLLSGQQSLEASSSSQRESTEADLTVAWNVLDFGLSYLRAKQQADRFLVAEERRRKVIHDIIQEVRHSFWRAVAAQQLMPEITIFLVEARRALADSKNAEQRLLQAPAKTLEYQMALLETIYQITTLQRDLAVARTQLAALLNLNLNSEFTLLAPTDAERPIPAFSYTLDTMENMAMILRPELREETYQGRIDAVETRSAILQLLPGFGVSGGYNMSSNRFLYQQNWVQGSMQVAWNMISVVNGPSVFKVGAAREQAARARRLSMGMAILTQVHVAKIRYDQTLEEFQLLNQMSQVAERARSYTEHGANLQTKTNLERIQSQARAVYRRLQKELAYAELQNAAGRLYLSLGIDPLPTTLQSDNLEDLSQILDTALQRWGSDFQDVAKLITPGKEAIPEPPDPSSQDLLSRGMDAIQRRWRADEMRSIHTPLPAEWLPSSAQPTPNTAH